MITNIFFDYGGVLGPSATTLISNHTNKDRIKQLFYEYDLLIGDKGTLQRFLNSKYKDLQITTEDIMSIFDTRERYEETWTMARKLKQNGFGIGLISDCFYELAQTTRNNEVNNLFNPLILSPEVKLAKRTKEIFEYTRNLVKANSNRLLMVDDNVNCLDRALEDEWNIIHFREPSLLEMQLKNLGVKI